MTNGQVVVIGEHRIDVLDPSGAWLKRRDAPVAWARLATMLHDGRVLVLGGSRAAVWNPRTDQWTAELEIAADATASMLFDGTVMLAGGATSEGETHTTVLVVPDGMGREAGASMCYPRKSHAAATLPEGRLLVTGGHRGERAGSEVEIYDPVIQEWRRALPMSTARSGHTATTLRDGRILVVGGVGHHRRDGDEGWRCPRDDLDPPPPPRVAITGNTIPDEMLVSVPARDEHLASAEIYAEGAWSTVPSMSHARADHSAVLLADGRVLVTGGRDDRGALATSEIFDPVTSTWTPAPAMTFPRARHTSLLLGDGSVLVVGGGAPRSERWSSALRRE